MAHLYLYGIIRSDGALSIANTGIDSTCPVYMLAANGLGCVVSDYSGEGFSGLTKEKLVRSLLAHQQVVEGVMSSHAVLPVKFGTTLDDARQARDLLSQGQEKLYNALASIESRVEVEVAATWNTGQVLQQVGCEDAVACAREALARKGQATVEDRVQLGQMVKAQMDKRRDAYQEQMVTFLRPTSVGVAPHALVSDSMVMNVAFLVERPRLHEFEARVHDLDQLFQERITFRFIGPLPPYSFSTVEVGQLDPEQVRLALQTLHLPEQASEAEVRKAYRRLAAQALRTATPETRPAQVDLARLREASHLLVSYCRARGLAGQGHVSDPLFTIVISGPRSVEAELDRLGDRNGA